MRDREYKDAWQTLKEENLKTYLKIIGQQRQSNTSIKQTMLEGASIWLGKKLTRMDQLDGTHEFSNLLHDMNRSE
ncbi:hypothetical protein [Mammaliicoccus sciuri]|uniref:hypothetical protein n=1 Tax=Mammaliicoccus sciuri TaxID=1296 RepID=UPI003F57B8EB